MKFGKVDYEKRLRDYLNSDIDQTYKNMLLNLFPELGESEDESIKNWCIAHFNECILVAKNDNAEYAEYLKNKVIPWLQKRTERSCWRPTPKQIEALRLLLEENEPYEGVIEVVKTLYNDLKNKIK
jgi:hypothetical protein